MERLALPVHIETGTALSDEVNVGKGRIVGIQMPAGWDAANITAQALTRQAGSVPTFGGVVDQAGNELVVVTAPAADEYVAIPDTVALVGLGRVKLRSGTAAIPVNQTADRDFFLVVLV